MSQSRALSVIPKQLWSNDQNVMVHSIEGFAEIKCDNYLSLCLVLRNTHTISYNLIKRLFIQNKYIWACSFSASNPSPQLTTLKIAKKWYVCFITIQNVNMKTCLWRWCPWLYDVVLLWYDNNIHCQAKVFEYMLHFYILFKILMNLLCTVWLLWSQICIDTYW